MQTRMAKLLGVSLALSILCLVLGVALAGRWEGGMAALILLSLGLLYHRLPAQWMPSLLLGLYTLAVAGGLLAGGSPFLLLGGVVTALAAWDLNHSISSLAGNARTNFGPDQQNKRLLLLAGVVGLSLAFINLGLLVRVSLPFGVILLLASAALGGLSMLIYLLQKNP
jgi:hypothetical protein